MSETYTAEGTVIKVGETQTFDSGFMKREFVIETLEEKYAQQLQFEVTNDKVSKLDHLKLGDKIKVSFNLRGREYNGKYFVNLQAWKMEMLEEAAASAGGGGVDDEIPFAEPSEIHFMW